MYVCMHETCWKIRKTQKAALHSCRQQSRGNSRASEGAGSDPQCGDGIAGPTGAEVPGE